MGSLPARDYSTASTMSVDDGHLRVTYNEIHKLIGAAAERIKNEFNPDLFVAIGGGGFFPARVMRTFCKVGGTKNIPIQAIGLSLYEELGGATEEQIGKEVVRTQWLDFSTLGKTPLLGRRVLIVDEVDDTRTTLAYAIAELQKDVKARLESLPEEKRKAMPPTEFAIFSTTSSRRRLAPSRSLSCTSPARTSRTSGWTTHGK